MEDHVSSDLGNRIKEIAGELDIDICRFTNCQDLSYRSKALSLRYRENRYTEFEELDMDRRLYPSLTMENAKSAIVIGLSYNVENPYSPKKKYLGRLSKSSWGMDYHVVLKNKMEALVATLKTYVDFNYVINVDTGPLLDRELAYKSGVGFFGKNNSIINPVYGSFIFIGHILTDLDLIEDSPLKMDCGDCDLCLRACPTGALEEAYKINSRRCISYLTQTKGDIDCELRPKLGDKIYGCDSCQLVCPKNKDCKIVSREEFIPNKTGGYVDLEELLSMSNKEFKEKYGHMAGSWRGKNVLKRNALIILANKKASDLMDLIELQAKSSSPLISEYGKWALLKIRR